VLIGGRLLSLSDEGRKSYLDSTGGKKLLLKFRRLFIPFFNTTSGYDCFISKTK
jgi:hypothetical protein